MGAAGVASAGVVRRPQRGPFRTGALVDRRGWPLIFLRSRSLSGTNPCRPCCRALRGHLAGGSTVAVRLAESVRRSRTAPLRGRSGGMGPLPGTPADQASAPRTTRSAAAEVPAQCRRPPGSSPSARGGTSNPHRIARSRRRTRRSRASATVSALDRPGPGRRWAGPAHLGGKTGPPATDRGPPRPDRGPGLPGPGRPARRSLVQFRQTAGPHRFLGVLPAQSASDGIPSLAVRAGQVYAPGKNCSAAIPCCRPTTG